MSYKRVNFPIGDGGGIKYGHYIIGGGQCVLKELKDSMFAVFI
jgi:hypothetical protein